jgi:transcriptional regulator with XRE-family HTH domain
MSQSIGKNIRKLRKERNLTQEELAELLNITSQAISKWENETGMPDISQIIPLASVFGVSTDLLFGISSTNEQNDVEKIIEDLHIKNKNLEIDDYEEYKQKSEALKHYPNNFTLLYSCFVKGCFLLQTEWQEKLSKEEQESIYNECIRQSNVIFSYCPNTDIVINTKRELVGLMVVKKEHEKAIKLISELPNNVTDVSSMILARFFIGNKNWSGAVETCHKNMYELLREMQHQSKLLASAYMRSGQYDKAEKTCRTMLDLIHAVFKDEAYTPPFHLEQQLYRFLAICALKKDDEMQAIRYLEEMCEYTLNQAQGFQKNMYVKTPLLETYKMEFNYPYYEPKKLLLAELEKECFKSISNNQLLLNLKQKIQNLPE